MYSVLPAGKLLTLLFALPRIASALLPESQPSATANRLPKPIAGRN